MGYAFSGVLAPLRVADFRVPKPWRKADHAAPCAPARYLGPPGANGEHFRPYPLRAGRNADQPNNLVRRHSCPCAKTQRRAQPLQSEAANAKKASETAIPGVLRMRPAPTDSVFGLVRFSNARTPFKQNLYGPSGSVPTAR